LIDGLKWLGHVVIDEATPAAERERLKILADEMQPLFEDPTSLKAWKRYVNKLRLHI
jgi:hypothetical protein